MISLNLKHHFALQSLDTICMNDLILNLNIQPLGLGPVAIATPSQV